MINQQQRILNKTNNDLPEGARVTVQISSQFWYEHATRLGEIGKHRVIKNGARVVTVELDDEALGELWFDACRMSDPGFNCETGEPEIRAEIRMAARVARKLARQFDLYAAELPWWAA